ncbi:MAG: hypothetical protein LUC91_09705 [Prevotella sp.]|nr:hypothetical protein [Prevotella sp.]
MRDCGDSDVIPECYIDTNLVETLLGVYGHEINHQKGCNNVTKTMDSRFKDRFAVGIIDKDKAMPTYIADFDAIAGSDHLTLLKHRVRNHYIVQVYPAIEEFVLSSAREMELDMAEYGLPSDVAGLRKETKRINVDDDARFKRLFKDLRNAREIKRLETIMAYLVKHKYNADAEILKSLFSSTH